MWQHSMSYARLSTAASGVIAPRLATVWSGHHPSRSSQCFKRVVLLPVPLYAAHRRVQHMAGGQSRSIMAAAAQQTLPELQDEAALEAPISSNDMTLEEPPTFAELGVDKLLVAGLAESGIEVPSPIQEASLPVLLQGNNAAVQSYTGSGKTLAYLLPAMTLALQRAEAAFRRQQAAAKAAARSGRRPVVAEEDGWSVQVLVVAPSQELAMQICRVAASLMPEAGRAAVQQAIGGANMRRQAEAIIEHQPLVVVGTPGRLADLIRAGALRLHRCPILILDEADQLLGDVYSSDMSHIVQHCGKRLAADNARPSKSSSSSSSSTSPEDAGDEQAVATLTPSQRQTVLVSATLWAGGLVRFKDWCPDPVFVTMGGAAPTLSPEADAGDGVTDANSADAKAWGWGAKGWEGPASVVQQGPKTQGMAGGAEGAALVPTLPPNLEHRYLVVSAAHRADAMRRALYAMGIEGMALGFMNWQQRLKDVAAKLEAKKITVGQLHGEMSALDRAAVLEGARRGTFQVMLVSDVAARGLDLPQIDVVVNIELPSNAAHYAHRAGRTGRMGAPGMVLTLIAPGERFVVERLSKKLGVPILECHLAGGELIVGPPAAKDTKKRKAPAHSDDTELQQQEQAALTEPARGSSASDSSQRSAGRTAAASRSAAVQGSAEPAAGAGAAEGDDDDFILDEDDEVDVEGDESLDAYKQRVRSELQQELEELQQEKQLLKQQRVQQRKLAADAAGASGAAAAGQPRANQRIIRKVPPGSVVKGSPQEAALMAIAAIEADERARKGKSKLPAALGNVKAVMMDEAEVGGAQQQQVQRRRTKGTKESRSRNKQQVYDKF